MTFEDFLIEFSIPVQESKAIAKHLFSIEGTSDTDLTDDESDAVLGFYQSAQNQGIKVKKAIADAKASANDETQSGQRPQNFGVQGRFAQQAQQIGNIREQAQKQQTQQARLGSMLRRIEAEAIEVAAIGDLESWRTGICEPQTDAEAQLFGLYNQVMSAKEALNGGGHNPLDRYGWVRSLETGEITFDLDTIALPMQTVNALPAAQ